MAIEDAFREGGDRTLNLDPGLLSLSRFALATTKDGSHRIPLRDGIYAEVTLVYERGGFHPLPWTVPGLPRSRASVPDRARKDDCAGRGTRRAASGARARKRAS